MSLARNLANLVKGIFVDSSNNVGIGTGSPAYKLSVLSSSDGTYGEYKSTAGANATALRFGISGNDAYISGTGNTSGNLSFLTYGTEKMRIDSSGNFMVATATPVARCTVENSASGAIAVAANFTGNGSVGYWGRYQAASGTAYYGWWHYNGNAVGSITSSGSTTVYGTTSDYRLKENVEPMQNALAAVAQLKPCTYTWKSTGEQSQGFIAHELQAVVPDAVVGEKDALNEDGSIKAQGIDTSFLVATLTAAIQEQQAIIEQLRADVEALKAVE
jgi:hypothetical protein